MIFYHIASNNFKSRKAPLYRKPNDNKKCLYREDLVSTASAVINKSPGIKTFVL